MSKQDIGTEQSLGLPPDMNRLEKWLGNTADARDAVDDVALLVALGEVKNGGQWKISLSIEDTVIVKATGEEIRPFDVVAPLLPNPKN